MTALASHLEFYAAHDISPVRQNIDDLERHFSRRRALYHQLAIPPSSLRGRRVLEVGPGSGHNALYTASLKPERYLLIEGNPQGVADMRVLFESHADLMHMAEIRETAIENVDSDERFDFVFCEGLLSGIANPEQVLDRLGALTAPGGLLTLTCVDHLSHFPETVRRALAQRLIDPSAALSDQVALLLPAFGPHLEALGGMSRRFDDWIVDNLIHPGSIIPLINLPEAIALLAERFDFWASSPRFATDWRWYKTIPDQPQGFNFGAIEQYWALAHNLLDHRQVLPPRESAWNQRLYDLCTEARSRLQRFEAARDECHMEAFVTLLEEIADETGHFNETAAAGLGAAARHLRQDRIDAAAIAGTDSFAALFGRGQQYFSLCKRV